MKRGPREPVATNYEGVFLVYHPASGHCYKELVTGTHSIDDLDHIAWRFPMYSHAEPYKVDGKWIHDAAPEPGQYRLLLAQRRAGEQWEVQVRQHELLGAPVDKQGLQLNLMGCTIHLVAGTGVFPERGTQYEAEPFAGLKFTLKRTGEIE